MLALPGVLGVVTSFGTIPLLDPAMDVPAGSSPRINLVIIIIQIRTIDRLLSIIIDCCRLSSIDIDYCRLVSISIDKYRLTIDKYRLNID